MNKHIWKTYGDIMPISDDTEVWLMAFGEGTHNGPMCIVCGFGFCHHCDKIEKTNKWDSECPVEQEEKTNG